MLSRHTVPSDSNCHHPWECQVHSLRQPGPFWPLLAPGADELMTTMAQMWDRCIGGTVPGAERGSQRLAGFGQEAISIRTWESPGKISSLCQFESQGMQMTLCLRQTALPETKGTIVRPTSLPPSRSSCIRRGVRFVPAHFLSRVPVSPFPTLNKPQKESRGVMLGAGKILKAI